MQKLTPYMQRADAKGEMWGITQESWAEVNFVETAADTVRGDHYHKETLELFFIIDGEIDIAVRDLRTGAETEITVKKGDVFIIEPYELHTFRTRTDAKWINMLSKAHDPQDPDFHRAGSSGT